MPRNRNVKQRRNLEQHPNQRRRNFLRKHPSQPKKQRSQYTIHDALDEVSFSDRVDQMRYDEFFGNKE